MPSFQQLEGYALDTLQRLGPLGMYQFLDHAYQDFHSVSRQEWYNVIWSLIGDGRITLNTQNGLEISTYDGTG